MQLIVGLDHAGKTTLVSTLQHQTCETHPTIGFSRPIFIRHKGYRLKLYDVGGGRCIRAIWGQYLPEVHGIIFVVDAANRARMSEAAEEFAKMLQNECARNKHILVLANKQDQAQALPPDIVDADLPLHALPYSLCASYFLAHFCSIGDCHLRFVLDSISFRIFCPSRVFYSLYRCFPLDPKPVMYPKREMKVPGLAYSNIVIVSGCFFFLSFRMHIIERSFKT